MIFDDMLINPYQPNVVYSLVVFALSRRDLSMNPVSREMCKDQSLFERSLLLAGLVFT